MRLLAPIAAVLAIAAICGAVVARLVAQARGHDTQDAAAALSPLLIAAVAAPACVGAFVADRPVRSPSAS